MNMLQEQINEKQAMILQEKSYLNATDYKVTRAFETKSEVDADTLQKRSEARERINQLEVEIIELQDENNSQQALPTELLP